MGNAGVALPSAADDSNAKPDSPSAGTTPAPAPASASSSSDASPGPAIPKFPRQSKATAPISPGDPDDFELMQQIAARDPVSFGKLYDRYSAGIFALGIRMLRDRAEAEDFLTEIFWEIWQKAARYDPSRGSPVTYLFMVARSRAIDWQRSAAPRKAAMADEAANRPASAGQSTEPNPAASLLDRERHDNIRAAMQQLDPSQREALELSFFDGLTHSEIAERLNKPLGTIKTHIRQALIRLRDCLRTQQGSL